MMKIKCFYYIRNNEIWFPVAKIIYGKSSKYYSKYLLNALDTIGQKRAQEMLEAIEKIEKEELEYYDYGHEIFDYRIYKEHVCFEYFFEDPNEEWENWWCSTKIVKQVIKEWQNFLKMPRDKDTVYEFEIPDSDL